MPEFQDLVKNLYTSKNRELTSEKLDYIQKTYTGKEQEFVKNFYATIGEELPQEKLNYISETYLKKKNGTQGTTPTAKPLQDGAATQKPTPTQSPLGVPTFNDLVLGGNKPQQEQIQPATTQGIDKFNEDTKRMLGGQGIGMQNNEQIAPKIKENFNQKEALAIQEERGKDLKEHTKEAIRNTAIKSLKNPTFKSPIVGREPTEDEIVAEEKLWDDLLKKGDVAITRDAKGNRVLGHPRGFFESVANRVEASVTDQIKAYDYHKALINEDYKGLAEKVEKEKAEKEQEPLPHSFDNGGVGNYFGGLAGDLPKLTALSAAGGALGSVTGGAGGAALFAAEGAYTGLKHNTDKLYEEILSKDPTISKEEAMEKALNAAKTEMIPDAIGMAALGSVGGKQVGLFNRLAAKAPEESAKNIFIDATKNALKGAAGFGGVMAGSEFAKTGIEDYNGFDRKSMDYIERSATAFKDGALVKLAFDLTHVGTDIYNNAPKYLKAAAKEYLATQPKEVIDYNLGLMGEKGQEIKQKLDDYRDVREQFKGLVPDEQIGTFASWQEKINSIKEKNKELETAKKDLPDTLQAEQDKKIDANNKEIATINKKLDHYKKTNNIAEVDDVTGEALNSKFEIDGKEVDEKTFTEAMDNGSLKDKQWHITNHPLVKEVIEKFGGKYDEISNSATNENTTTNGDTKTQGEEIKVEKPTIEVVEGVGEGNEPIASNESSVSTTEPIEATQPTKGTAEEISQPIELSPIDTSKKVELTKEAQDLLDSGGVPSVVTNNLKRIATENGIEVTDATKPQEIIDRLKNKIKPTEEVKVEEPNVSETEKVITKPNISEEPPLPKGETIVTPNGLTESERQVLIEKRKKSTAITEQEKIENGLVALTKKLNAVGTLPTDKRNINSKISQLVRRLNAESGYEKYRYNNNGVVGKNTTVRKGSIKGATRFKPLSKVNRDANNGSIKEDAVVFTERPENVRDTYDNLLDADQLQYLHVLDASGKKAMSKDQISAAMSDIENGIPSIGADNLLNTVEQATKDGNLPIIENGHKFPIPLEAVLNVKKEVVGEPFDEKNLMSWLNDESHNLTPEHQQILDNELNNIIYEHEQGGIETEIPKFELTAETTSDKVAEPKVSDATVNEKAQPTEIKVEEKPTDVPREKSEPIADKEPPPTPPINSSGDSSGVKSEKITIDGVHIELPPFQNRHSDIDRVRNKMGFDEITAEHIPILEQKRRANEIINEWQKDGTYDKNVKELITRGLTSKIDLDEQNVLTQHAANLEYALQDGKIDRYSEDYDKLSAEYDDTLRTLRKSGSDAARQLSNRALYAVQHSDMIPTSLLDVETKMREDNVQLNLTDEQKKDAERIWENFKDFHKEEEVSKELFNEIIKLATQDYLEQAKEQAKKTNTPAKSKKTKDDYKAERVSIKQSIKDKLRESRGKANDVVNASIDFLKLAPDVFKLIRSYVEEASDITLNKVKEYLKKDLEEATEEKIPDEEINKFVAGEYFKKGNKQSDVNKKLYELKQEQKYLNDYELLQQGIYPKTKKKATAVEKNQALRELRERNEKLYKELELGKYSDEAKNGAAQKSAQKSIDDLQEKIDNNELEIEKAEKLNETAKTKELREKRDDLRNEIEQKRKDAKVGKYSDEAKFESSANAKIKANEKAIAEYERRLKEGDFIPNVPIKSIFENSKLRKENQSLFNKFQESEARKDQLALDYYKAMTKNEQQGKHKYNKALDKVGGIANTTIATLQGTQAMFDRSLFYVQNLPMVLSHPFRTAAAEKFFWRDAAKKKIFDTQMAILHRSEFWKELEDVELAIYEPTSSKTELHNEMHGGEANLWRKTKIGQAIERGNASFQNNIRLTAYLEATHQYRNGENAIPYESNPKIYKDIARVINEMTSHGKVLDGIKNSKSTSAFVNRVIWSTKMFSARLNLLGFGDIIRPKGMMEEIGKSLGLKVKQTDASRGFYSSLSPEARKFAMKEVGRALTMGTSILIGAYAYKIANNKSDEELDVEFDPHSPYFGSVIVGGEPISVFGSASSILGSIVQVASGKKKSTKTNEKVYLGEKFGDKTSGQVAFGSLVRGKMTPSAGLMYDYFGNNGKNYYTGERMNWSNTATNAVLPFSVRDMTYDIKNNNAIVATSKTLAKLYGFNIKSKAQFEAQSKEIKEQEKKYKQEHPEKFKKTSSNSSSGTHNKKSKSQPIQN